MLSSAPGHLTQMEITKLDSPDDDGLMSRLAQLCERVDDLLDRVRGGEQIPVADVGAVQRESVLLGIEKDLGLFRRYVAQVPSINN